MFKLLKDRDFRRHRIQVHGRNSQCFGVNSASPEPTKPMIVCCLRLLVVLRNTEKKPLRNENQQLQKQQAAELNTFFCIALGN